MGSQKAYGTKSTSGGDKEVDSYGLLVCLCELVANINLVVHLVEWLEFTYYYILK